MSSIITEKYIKGVIKDLLSYVEASKTLKTNPQIPELVNNILTKINSTVNNSFTRNFKKMRRLFYLLPTDKKEPWSDRITQYLFSHAGKRRNAKIKIFIEEAFLCNDIASLKLIPASSLSLEKRKDKIHQAFYLATINDNVDFVKEILEIWEGAFALLAEGACKSGSLNIFRYLSVECTSKPAHFSLSKLLSDMCDLQNEVGALKFAIDRCSKEELIASGAILMVASNNNLQILKYLIEKGVPIDFRVTEDEETPLFKAVGVNNCEMVKFLTSKNPDKTIKDQLGRTPLHIAFINNCSDEIIENLVHYGFRLEEPDKAGITPLEYFVSSLKNDIIPRDKIQKLILLLGERKDILLHSFAKNCSNQFQLSNALTLLLNELQCDPNVLNLKGQTPFQTAVLASNKAFISQFRHKPQFSLLDIAKGDLHFIKGLINTFVIGAHDQDSNGNNLTHLAVLQQNFLLLNNLIDFYKLPLFKTNNLGETPLDIACKRKFIPFVRSLIPISPLVLYNPAKLMNCPLYHAWNGANGDFVKFLCHEVKVPLQQHLSMAYHFKNKIGLQYLLDSNYKTQLSDINARLLLSTACYLSDEKAFELVKNNPKQLMNCFAKFIDTSTDREFYAKLVSLDCIEHKSTNTNGETYLHIACKKGDVAFVRPLIETQMYTLNAPNNRGELPLFLALENDSVELVKYLIEEVKLNPLSKNNQGDSLFFAALKSKKHLVATYLHNRNHYSVEDLSLDFPIQKENEAIALDLLEKGASPNSLNREWGYPLQAACLNGFGKILNALLEKGADPNIKGGAHEFPLLIACKSGNGDMAVQLINYGAYVNVKDSDGEFPLTYACINKLDEVACLLLDKGADARCKGPDGLSVLYKGAQFGLIRLVKRLVEDLLFDQSTHPELLERAVRGGNYDLFLYLVENEKLPIDQNGNIFKLALSNGHLEIVRYLIENNFFSPYYKDNAGLITLHHAYKSDNIELLTYLIDSLKLDPEVQKGAQYSPFVQACSAGKIKTVQFHLERYSPIPEERQGGLWKACEGGHFDLVEYFLDVKKVPPPIKSHDKSTLLHAACEYGHMNIVCYLIDKHGMKADQKSMRGFTPIDMACLHNQLNVVKFLHEEKKIILLPHFIIEAAALGHKLLLTYLINKLPNAIFSTEDKLGRKAIHVASFQGRKEIVSLLIEGNRYFSVDIPDRLQNTPLHYACMKNRLAVVQYLKKQKCYLQPLNGKSQTPLHLACIEGHKDIVEYLVKEGHLLDLQDESGNTPLHYLAISSIPQTKEIALFLLEKGANAEIKNKKRETPLLLASHHENKSLIEKLLEGKNFSFIPGSLKNSYGEVVRLLRRESYRINPDYYHPSCKIKQEHFAHVDEINFNGANTPQCDYMKELKTLFKTLNFSEPNQPAYLDPDKITDDGVLVKNRATNVIAALEKALHTFSTQLNNRGREMINGIWKNTLLAAPPLTNNEESPNRKLYFDQLQFLVYHTIEKMKQEDCDPVAKSEYLLSFVIAGFGHCATRYLGEAHAAYEYLVLGKVVTLEDKIHKMYANQRLGFVEQISTNANNSMNTHMFNTLMSHLKKERGIPGVFYEGDPYMRHEDKTKQLNSFDNLYTVKAIVQRLDAALNGPSREFEIDEVNNWFVDNLMPNDWMAHLPEESERRNHFLKRSVMNSQGEVKYSSLLQMLEKLNIIDASPLHWALEVNKYEQWGFDLLEAIEDDDEADNALALIKKGALLNIEDSTGREPLQIAAAARSIDLVKELVRQGVALDHKDHMGMTALHEASANNCMEIVKFLINSGAKPGIKTKKKQTPLHFAAKHSDGEIYSFLIEKGVDDSLLDGDGRTSRYYATLNKLPHSLLGKRVESTSENPLFEVCKKGKVDALEGLIDNPTFVQSVDKDGYTPLHHACKSGSTLIVKELLAQHPLGLWRETNDGETILHCACYTNNSDLIKFLISQGIGLGKPNLQGNTPLYVALTNNRIEAAKELLRNGVIIDSSSYRVARSDNAIEVEYENGHMKFKGDLIEGLETNDSVIAQLIKLEEKLYKRRKINDHL